MAAMVSTAGFVRLAYSSTRFCQRAARPASCHIRGSIVQQSYVKSFSASSRVAEKKYSEDHEWIELASDGETGTIGISEYAAKALGDVVYVELPEVDNQVSQGDAIGAVESVKSASDIMSPVSGTIIEANSVLEEQPTVINKSAEGDGWIARIKVSDAKEMDNLMDKDAYAKFTED